MVQSRQPGSYCILVVDDEQVVRNYVKCVLESAGYKVLLAVNGTQALLTSVDSSIQIDLLLTDVEMGEALNGLELAADFNMLRPDAGILITSGTALPERINDGNRSGLEWGFLPKPSSMQRLLKDVAQALPKVSRFLTTALSSPSQILAFR